MTFKCHAGHCTIFSALINGKPEDGICTCGYGLEYACRYGSSEKMYSFERLEAASRERDKRRKELDEFEHSH